MIKTEMLILKPSYDAPVLNMKTGLNKCTDFKKQILNFVKELLITFLKAKSYKI